MLDILAKAKKQGLPKNVLHIIEAAIEYALADIAEDHFVRSKGKSWRESYNYAISLMSPEDGGDLIIRRAKKEYPQILEVNASADIKKVSRGHFLNLLQHKDPAAVIAALTNLKRWRGSDSELSSWCEAMITSLVHDYNSTIGPGGVCKCSKCGAEMPHIAGIPCTEVQCPECGSLMLRKGVLPQLYIPEDPSFGESEDEDEEETLDVSLDESPRPLEAETIGNCVCPACGYTVPATGTPCEDMECPKCPGVMMEFKEKGVSKVSSKNKKLKKTLKVRKK